MDDFIIFSTQLKRLQSNQKERNSLDDLLTVYESYIIKKMGNEAYTQELIEVLLAYSWDDVEEIASLCNLLLLKEDKIKVLQSLNKSTNNNMYQKINRRILRLFSQKENH